MGYKSRLERALRNVVEQARWCPTRSKGHSSVALCAEPPSLSLDLRQFRAAFFTYTVAPCGVDLSDDEGDDDLEEESENYTCTLLDEDGRECGQRWPTARALAGHQRYTQGGTHGEPK